MNTQSRYLDIPGVRIVLSDGLRRGPAHAHAWPTAMILIDGPTNHWRIDAGEVALIPGQAMLMNAFEMHEGLDRDEVSDRRLLCVLMSPETISSLAPPDAPAPSPDLPFVSSKVTLPLSCRAAATSLVGLLDECCPNETAAPELARSLAASLLASFAIPAAAQKRPVLDARLHHAIARARATPESVSVQDMVEISGLSRSRFFELFTAAMGLPPQAYLDALLLCRVLEKLHVDRKPVAAVARELGFAVPDTFTRFVAREVGLTPRAFRKIVAGMNA